MFDHFVVLAFKGLTLFFPSVRMSHYHRLMSLAASTSLHKEEWFVVEAMEPLSL